MSEIDFNDVDLKQPMNLPSSLYWSIDYLTPKRFASIGYQWTLAIQSTGSSFLEIGVGNGLLTYLLRKRGFTVYSVDINHQLRPSFVANVSHLPITRKSVDTILCYEVLEHLPFELMFSVLGELTRIAKKKLIISLPNLLPYKTRSTFWHKLVRFLKRDSNQMEEDVKISSAHYWEIGYKSIQVSTIIDIAENTELSLEKHFRNPYNPYHHFFVFHV